MKTVSQLVGLSVGRSVGQSSVCHNFIKGRVVTLPRSKRSSFIYTRCNPNPTNISVNTLTQVKLFWHLYNHKNIHQAGYITTVRKRVVPFGLYPFFIIYFFICPSELDFFILPILSIFKKENIK